MIQYRKALILFLTFVILFELMVIAVGTAARPSWSHWGDEWHFQNTIKRFGEEISLYNLKHYEEMSTPLPFLAYALWGRLFGFELFPLRTFSLLVALITYLLFHRLLFVASGSAASAFWGSALLIGQPYMIGFSIFIYTDMLAILFLISACLAHMKGRATWMGVSLALALLCRQYIGFLVLAVAVYHILRYLSLRQKKDLQMLAGCVQACVPYAALVFYWGGLSPDSSMRTRYLDEGLYYHPAVLSLYVGLLFVYLWPLLALRWRLLFRDYKAWLIALISSVFYLVFPVAPSKPSVDVGIFTVGLFHRALRFVWNDETFVQVVFYVSFVLAFPVLACVVHSLVQKLRARRFDFALMLDLSIVSFFIVMPFSYLGWEKYFLPVVPLVILRLVLSGTRAPAVR
ncbi:MAG: glycosyltransferase family 39 protein [Candidatus Zixiibacteriota bacterium]|nr:MAG: glycosyltransferase family 39 protein [candidate division Zixibacteria bacterium]